MIEKRRKGVVNTEEDDDSNEPEIIKENRKQNFKYSSTLILLCTFLFISYICYKDETFQHSMRTLLSCYKNVQNDAHIGNSAKTPIDIPVYNKKDTQLRSKKRKSPTELLENEVKAQLEVVREMKFVQHNNMENNEDAKKEISLLQDKLRQFIPLKYGPGPYRVGMKLRFPESMKDPNLPDEMGLIIELAPIQLVPYSVYYFLEIVSHWNGGAFHRRAGHVLQALTQTRLPSLAFQEYHPDFPHKKHTFGYAGRPGGPAFYISIMDNTANHGPGSQGSRTEADSCFGRLEPGFEGVIERMKKQPGAGKPSGFVSNKNNHIRILSLELLPSGSTWKIF